MSPLEYLAPFESALRMFVRATPSPIEDIDDMLMPSHARQAHNSRLSAMLNESEIFVSRLNTFIEDLNELRRTHEQRRAFLHNTLQAPLLALPPEIIGYIFELVTNTVSPDHGSHGLVRQATRLTHICSQWRMIGVHNRRLWNRISLDMAESPQLWDMWLARSAEGPIDVWAYKGDQVSILQQLRPRIRYLYLNGIPQTQSGSFDRLETLVIEYRGADSFFASGWNTPALRHLSLGGYGSNLPVPESIQSSLRTLYIHNPSPTSNWVSLLVSLTHLERLYLSHCPPVKNGVLQMIRGEPQLLESLTHLEFSSIPSTLAMILFSRCINLKGISFGTMYRHHQDPHDFQASANDIIECLRHLPRLEYLACRTWASHLMEWPSFFETFSRHIHNDPHFLPRLQVLHITEHWSKSIALTPDIRQIAQALHGRYSNILNITFNHPKQKRYPRLFIDNDFIWKEEHEWYQTLDGLVGRVPYEDVFPSWDST